MRASFLFILLCLTAAGSLLATDIAPEDAGKHVGEKVPVRGVVVQAVFSKTKNGHLNFGAKYPNRIFSVAVLNQKTPALLANGPGWLIELQGKEVAVTGTVELYEGKPEIVLAAREDVTTSTGK